MGAKGRKSSARKKWKFTKQETDASDALDAQIASLTAWCEFLAVIDWSKVPQRGSTPGSDKNPPPPPPPWPPA